jgi:hypothetical protein
MKWKEPPTIKIYEALGAVADERIAVNGDSAKVYSSSGNKYYDVNYDPAAQAIMANDNGSYWKGYLGYPAIAFLLATDVLPYQPEYGDLLKGIAWKDINQKYKNDFDKTLAHIFEPLTPEQKEGLQEYVFALQDELRTLSLSVLGKKVLPPEGY